MTSAGYWEKPGLQMSHSIVSRCVGTKTPALSETFSHGATPAGSIAWGVQEVLPPKKPDDLQTTYPVATLW